jgi:hypothetical protein
VGVCWWASPAARLRSDAGRWGWGMGVTRELLRYRTMGSFGKREGRGYNAPDPSASTCLSRWTPAASLSVRYLPGPILRCKVVRHDVCRQRHNARAHRDQGDNVVRGHIRAPSISVFSGDGRPPRWLARCRRWFGSGCAPLPTLVANAIALLGPLRASPLVLRLVPLVGAPLGSAVHPPLREAVLGGARPLCRAVLRVGGPLGLSASPFPPP